MNLEKYVHDLSVEDLREALEEAGLQAGPITNSTEKVYRRMLLRHIQDIDKDALSLLSTSSASGEFEENSVSGIRLLLSPDPEDVELEVARYMLEFESQPSNWSSPIRPTSETPPQREEDESFTPIRWNQALQQYEPLVYGQGGNSGANKLERKPTGNKKWQIITAVCVAIIALLVVCVTTFMTGGQDPYKHLEEVASNVVQKAKRSAAKMAID